MPLKSSKGGASKVLWHFSMKCFRGQEGLVARIHPPNIETFSNTFRHLRLALFALFSFLKIEPQAHTLRVLHGSWYEHLKENGCEFASNEASSTEAKTNCHTPARLLSYCPIILASVRLLFFSFFFWNHPIIFAEEYLKQSVVCSHFSRYQFAASLLHDHTPITPSTAPLRDLGLAAIIGLYSYIHLSNQFHYLGVYHTHGWVHIFMKNYVSCLNYFTL